MYQASLFSQRRNHLATDSDVDWDLAADFEWDLNLGVDVDLILDLCMDSDLSFVNLEKILLF